MLHEGTNPKQAIPIISATRAFKMLKGGCPIYLSTVKVVGIKEHDPKEISILQDFQGVFQEVSGLPPNREIEFMIGLIPGTASISKALYRMTPTELAELKA